MKIVYKKGGKFITEEVNKLYFLPNGGSVKIIEDVPDEGVEKSDEDFRMDTIDSLKAHRMLEMGEDFYNKMYN